MGKSCQHTTTLRIEPLFYTTASGRQEMVGREVVCGECGDIWEFRTRTQLPAWLQQELKNRGL